MKESTTAISFLALLVVIAIPAIASTENLYLPSLFLLITVTITLVVLRSQQKAFYVLCSGELFIIAARGFLLFTISMEVVLIGLFLQLSGALACYRDWAAYFSIVIIAIPVYLFFFTIHSQAIKVLLLCGGTAFAIVILALSLYRIKATFLSETVW